MSKKSAGRTAVSRKRKEFRPLYRVGTTDFGCHALAGVSMLVRHRDHVDRRALRATCRRFYPRAARVRCTRLLSRAFVPLRLKTLEAKYLARQRGDTFK
jgi:predicted component of type VI protein secretion system